ncbi:MAG: DNA repair protein RecO [Balneolia bacterium]|nr:DNA repair protein RecO [Balneolia bacterium]
MLAESPAIVLKAVDFKESSKIITLFSREHGKVAVLVRGFKRKKSRYAGIMAYGSVIDAFYYYKESRGVQTIKDAEMRIGTVKTQSDFNKLAVAMALLELISQVIQEGEPNDELYQFTESFLKWLNDTVESPRNLFPYLQIRLAELLGVGIQADEWLTNKAPEEVVYLNILSGNVSEVPDDGLSFKLSSVQTRYIQRALLGQTAGIPKMNIDTQELKQLIYHLDVYLKHHVDGVRDRKSDSVFEQIL